MKRLGTALACFLLSGCTPPWTAWTLKHDAKIAARDAAKLKAATDALDAKYQADLAASNAVIDGLKADSANKATRRAAVDTYVRGTKTVLFDLVLPDAAKVGVSQVLINYAAQNGDPLTAHQIAWLSPIITQLEAQDAKDVSEAKAALQAKQAELDLARQAETSQIAQNGKLEAAKRDADAQVQTLSQQVAAAKACITAQLSKANAYLAKYSWLRSTLVSIAWTVGIVIGIGAILAVLSIVWPPIYPISKGYRLVVTQATKLLFMPIHWLYDVIEKDLAKPSPTPTTASNPQPK